MINNQFKSDKADRVGLIAAMMISNELEDRMPEGEISRLPPSDHGEIFTAACKALKFVAKMHREHPTQWDGVVWFELFSKPEKGSLADRLVEMLVSDMPTNENVRLVVIDWLEAVGL
jgi:hypothetical protein